MLCECQQAGLCPRHQVEKTDYQWQCCQDDAYCRKYDSIFGVRGEGRVEPPRRVLSPDEQMFHAARQALPCGGPDGAVVLGLRVFPGCGCQNVGEMLWPGAVSLAERILAQSWPDGQTAVDLGCGVGLAGLTAAKAGLAVTLIDQEEHVVARARRALAANGLPALVHQANWTQVFQRFDHVFASEVLYRNDMQETLAEWIARCWTRKGVCWIVDPLRKGSDIFEKALAGFGLDVHRQTIGGEFADRKWLTTLFACRGKEEELASRAP